jgi:hypothetical protein
VLGFLSTTIRWPVTGGAGVFQVFCATGGDERRVRNMFWILCKQNKNIRIRVE